MNIELFSSRVEEGSPRYTVRANKYKVTITKRSDVDWVEPIAAFLEELRRLEALKTKPRHE